MDVSQFSKINLQCPVCLNEIEATVWQTVEAAADPDLKEKLLRKDLQAQQCPNCGHTWLPALPLVYRDEAAKLMFYCHAGQNPEEAQASAAALTGLDGWTLRLVTDYNSLIEKIHIADHHCDDRLIEFIKLAVKRQGLEDQETAIEQMLFLTADDQAFRFLVAGADASWTSVDLESSIYLNAENLTEGRLPDQTGQWLSVGEQFAEDLLRQLAEAD